ncbi:MAG: lysyl endopeptidase [Saprospiraceae bacterium]
MPSVDVEAVLKKDKKDGKRLPRFGIKKPMNLDTQDGTFYEFGNYSIWKLKIHSDGAQSLNFEFINLNLPVGSKMYIYGEDGKMIHGSITSDCVHEGIFSSDIVSGESAIIEVFLPQNAVRKFSIFLENAIHGIKKSTKAFGDSQPCNVNVACLAGNGFEDEINAVCLIRANNTDHCTGTLINNECNDFTPFLLTAQHCVNGQDVTNWTFRFKYETSVCTGGSEPKAKQYITFSGANLRASFQGSDFGLLQLMSPILPHHNLNFAGWDRSMNIPINSTWIHHPIGDVKKITFDAVAPTIDPTAPSGLPVAAGMSFMVNLFDGVGGDFGALEGGSSGAALINQAQRIVGQHSGGFPASCSSSYSKWSGRFFNSWTGGGTAATRLSNWLGGTNNPITTNTVSIPVITGSDVVCTNNFSYSLQDPLPGYNISWSVTPTSLFSSATSGNGSVAVLSALNSSISGAATLTLTFTLNNDGCGSVQTFTKNIWVGKPSINGFRFPDCFSEGRLYSLDADVSGGQQFTWNFPDCDFGIGNDIPGCWNYISNSSGSTAYVQAGNQPSSGDQGLITLTASNQCGSTTMSYSIIWCDEGGGGPKSGFNGSDVNTFMKNEKNINLSVYPNPTENTLNIKINQNFSSEETKNLQLIDLNGKVVIRQFFRGNTHQLDASKLHSGVFYLQITDTDSFVYQKVIIQ